MQGVILHYDPLTQRGLLRDESGQTHYFGAANLAGGQDVVAGQPVTLTRLPDTTLRVSPVANGTNDAGNVVEPERPNPNVVNEPTTYYEAVVQPTGRQTAQRPVSVSELTGWHNWPGMLLTATALVLLVLAGGGLKPSGLRNPKLIESVFGVVAAGLLALEINFFRVGAAIGRVRRVYWLIVVFSMLASFSQGCSGFQADWAADWYKYTLIVLGLAVYLLPYQRRYP